MRQPSSLFTKLKSLTECLEKLSRKKALLGALALGISAAAATPSSAALFSDDFSTDTSANYLLTDTYGAGTSTFDVSSGTLNVVPDPSNTVDVFHTTAQLEAGEYVRIDAPASNNRDFYLTVSSTTRGPNTGSEDGIRFNVQNAGQFRTRTYRDGAGTNATYPSTDAALDLTLYVFRDTNTEYRVGYDSGSGLTILDTITITETAGATGLYVGVEAFESASDVTYAFDNLEIGAVPEPTSAALALLAGIALVGSRRRKRA